MAIRAERVQTLCAEIGKEISVKEAIKLLIKSVLKDDRMSDIMTRRARGETFAMIGQAYGNKKQNIQRIEEQAMRRFKIAERNAGIIYRIIEELNKDTEITEEEIRDYIGNVYGDIYVYCLKKAMKKDDENSEKYYIQGLSGEKVDDKWVFRKK